MISFSEIYEDEYVQRTVSRLMKLGFSRDELVSMMFLSYSDFVRYAERDSKKDNKKYFLMSFVNRVRDEFRKCRTVQDSEVLFSESGYGVDVTKYEESCKGNDIVLTDEEIEYLRTHSISLKGLRRVFKERADEILEVVSMVLENKRDSFYKRKREKKEVDMLTKNEIWWYNLMYKGKGKSNKFTSYIESNVDSGVAESDVDCFARAYDEIECKDCDLKEECMVASSYFQNVYLYGRSPKDVFSFSKFRFLQHELQKEGIEVKGLKDLIEVLQQKEEEEMNLVERLAINSNKIELVVDCFGFHSEVDEQCRNCYLQDLCNRYTKDVFGESFSENVSEKKRKRSIKEKKEVKKEEKADKKKKEEKVEISLKENYDTKEYKDKYKIMFDDWFVYMYKNIDRLEFYKIGDKLLKKIKKIFSDYKISETKSYVAVKGSGCKEIFEKRFLLK